MRSHEYGNEIMSVKTAGCQAFKGQRGEDVWSDDVCVAQRLHGALVRAAKARGLWALTLGGSTTVGLDESWFCL